jgi:hypothetical protein
MFSGFSLKIFGPFLKLVIWFLLLLNFKCSFYILDTSPSLDMPVASVFSNLWFVFPSSCHFLSAEWKGFISMKSSMSIISFIKGVFGVIS